MEKMVFNVCILPPARALSVTVCEQSYFRFYSTHCPDTTLDWAHPMKCTFIRSCLRRQVKPRGPHSTGRDLLFECARRLLL